eukprot:scaffold56682_cov19-Prasinocladus_malaysianus.AAC.1
MAAFCPPNVPKDAISRDPVAPRRKHVGYYRFCAPWRTDFNFAYPCRIARSVGSDWVGPDVIRSPLDQTLNAIDASVGDMNWMRLSIPCTDPYARPTPEISQLGRRSTIHSPPTPAYRTKARG